MLTKRHKTLSEPGLGCCSKTKVKLHLKQGAKPVFRPKRPVPYASKSIVEDELKRLQAEGIIQRVDYSDWAAPIVVVKKANGKVRICADFSTGLNSMLDSHEYPLPVPEDLFAKLNGGRYFAKLDLADAYLQVPVDDESKKLLTINTHLGLFQYNRLPFGVKTAPAIFQQLMDAILSDVPGTVVYLNDALVTGSDPQDLMHKLEIVFCHLEEAGFKLRVDRREEFQPLRQTDCSVGLRYF